MISLQTAYMFSSTLQFVKFSLSVNVSFEKELSKKLMIEIKLSMKNYKLEDDRFKHASFYQPANRAFSFFVSVPRRSSRGVLYVMAGFSDLPHRTQAH